MIQKKFIGNVFLFPLILLIACGDDSVEGDDESETFRLTTIVQPDHTWTETAEIFNEELQERSDGRFEVEIYPASQLGSEAEMIDQMSAGSVDFGIITTSYLASRNDSLNVWFMPMLFDGVEDAIGARDTDTSQELLDMFTQENLVGLDWLFSGNHSVMMSEEVMDDPSAFEGKQIRAPETPVISDFYALMGAGSESMPLTEVYNSLQTGVVDGVNASAESATTEAYYEVADHFTFSQPFAWNAAVLMSEDSFDTLSEEDQNIVLDAMEEAVDQGNELAISEEQQNLEYLAEQDVNVEYDIDEESFQPYLDEIYEQYTSDDPKIEAFVEEVETN